MAIIDADAHVVENEHTWEFVDESDRHARASGRRARARRVLEARRCHGSATICSSSCPASCDSASSSSSKSAQSAHSSRSAVAGGLQCYLFCKNPQSSPIVSGTSRRNVFQNCSCSFPTVILEFFRTAGRNFGVLRVVCRCHWFPISGSEFFIDVNPRSPGFS